MNRKTTRLVAGLWVLLGLLSMLSACGPPTKPVPDKTGSAKPTASGSSSGVPIIRVKSPHADAAMGLLDTSKLNDRERDELKLQLGEAMSPCPTVPVSLAQCLAEKRDCNLCKPAGNTLARWVRAGVPANESGALLTKRFDPKEVKEIALGNAPIKGPPDAPVTLVEWADFECSACQAMVFAMDLLFERFPGQLRIAYKTYALPKHPHAPEAAYAAIAAYRQGKFWDMHKVLFTNQQQLEKKDLFRYARQLDVDFNQFKKDFEDPELRKVLKDDMDQGDGLGIEGTPSFFINGRAVTLPFYEELEQWVKLEIELAGKTPAEPTALWKEMWAKVEASQAEQAVPDGSAAPSAAPSAGPPPSSSATPSAAPSAAPSASSKPKGTKPGAPFP